MLQSLPSDAKWCGPAAVSALTGKSYGETLRVLDRIKAQQEVTGIWGEDVILTLGEFGYVATAVPIPRLMQLQTFIAGRTASNGSGMMAVSMILFWPALFAVGNNDVSPQLAQVKGEAEALQAAAIQNNCT